MLHEFAVDPKVLSTWKDFRYFIDFFGVPHGRLISRFPERWKAMVLEACDANPDCLPVQRNTIEDRLRRREFDGKLLCILRSYDTAHAWLHNAERAHRTQPFHAIISTDNPNGNGDVLIADGLDMTNAKLNVPRQVLIPSRAADLARALAPQLRNSEHVLLIDPHFKPEQPRWRPTLEELDRAATNGNRRLQRLEYHLGENSPAGSFKKDCERELPRLFHRGIEVCFVRWRQRGGGQALHARFILTERGGVDIDPGLDQRGQGAMTKVTLLDEHVYQQVWSQFPPDRNQTTRTTYQFVDEVRITGTR